MPADSRSNGPLFVVLASALWGTSGTAQAFAPQSADPISVGVVKIGVGGAAMLLFAALSGALAKGPVASTRWTPLPVLACAVLVAAYQTLFFTGISLTGVALGTISAIGSLPVWAGLADLFYGKRPDARWLGATALAVAGCALLVGSGGPLSADPLGVLLCVFSGGGLVAFTTIAKGMLEDRPHAVVMGVTFTLGAVVLSPALFFSDPSWVLSTAGIAVTLELGIGATALAYILFANGLSKVSVSTAATLSLAEPLTAGLLGLIILGERISPIAVWGMGLLVLGLLLATVKRG
ncbi:EamA family transporter [Rubrobacter tropicus]|uniref:EamA family transporter n=1 Tax=Rubrobacter tropicus TaxID=2653851 RepID=A0A6G8Q963_9ACTN|nr:EamA family transporter [Rubrobacter tropicus]QIN83020.1 EamA family transporter [Rubrobacter tropicus]